MLQHPERISDEMAMLLMQAAAPIYAAYLAARLPKAKDGLLPTPAKQRLMGLAIGEARLLWQQVRELQKSAELHDLRMEELALKRKSQD